MSNLSLIVNHEFIRFLVVLVHVFASTMAVGSILHSYIQFFASGYLISRTEVLLEHKIIEICIAVLLISGGLIVYLDYGLITSAADLFSHVKLTIKLLDVLVLMINGLFIKYFIIPKLVHSSQFSKKMTLVFGIGAGISLACWFGAIIIGKGKILIEVFHFEMFSFLILFFTILILGAIVGAISSIFIKIKIEK